MWTALLVVAAIFGLSFACSLAIARFIAAGDGRTEEERREDEIADLEAMLR